MWNLSQPGIELVSSAMRDGLLITGPPGKPLPGLSFALYVPVRWHFAVFERVPAPSSSSPRHRLTKNFPRPGCSCMSLWVMDLHGTWPHLWATLTHIERNSLFISFSLLLILLRRQFSSRQTFLTTDWIPLPKERVTELTEAQLAYTYHNSF